MKKIMNVLLVVLMVLMTTPSFSQLRFGLGLLGGIPVGDFGDVADFGAGAYLEGKYAVTENIDVGVHLGAMGFAGADIGVSGTSVSVGSFGIVPLLFTGEYVFLGGPVSPYAGIGIGPYFISGGDVSVSGSSVGGSVSSGTEFGFAPEFGVYLGKFNLSISYNIAGDFNFINFGLGILIGNRG